MSDRLSVDIGSLKLANPVMTASGTFGQATEFEAFFDLNQLGAIVVKTITPDPRAGNAPPRTHETAAGMLNSIGLPGPGIEGFLADELPRMAHLDVPVVINVAGENEKQFTELAARLADVPGVAAIEVNLSCPNVTEGGVNYAQDPVVTERILASMRKVYDRPLIAKLSPIVADIAVIARAAERAGADAVSLVNTFLGMAVDWRRRRPVLRNLVGGLSGPAIKPLALHLVHRAARAVSIPVIGIGGITTPEDAMEFIVAGASAIQIGTASFFDPMAAPKIAERLPSMLDEMGAESIRDAIGALRRAEEAE